VKEFLGNSSKRWPKSSFKKENLPKWGV